MSVRKSHNLGRNHIKLVVEYYEQAALEENLLPGAFPSAAVAAAAGGDPALAAASSGAKLDQSKELDSFSESGAPGTEGKTKEDLFDELVGDKWLVPPVHLAGLPAPPGQFFLVPQPPGAVLTAPPPMPAALLSAAVHQQQQNRERERDQPNDRKPNFINRDRGDYNGSHHGNYGYNNNSSHYSNNNNNSNINNNNYINNGSDNNYYGKSNSSGYRNSSGGDRYNNSNGGNYGSGGSRYNNNNNSRYTSNNSGSSSRLGYRERYE